MATNGFFAEWLYAERTFYECIHSLVLSKIFFIRQFEIIYDRIICTFTISLSYPRTHLLSSFSPFSYVFLAQ